jgi:hypothetical protein
VAPERKTFTVRIDGVDLTRQIRVVTVRPEEHIIDIELLPELRSETGEAYRHLQGLKKAKN